MYTIIVDVNVEFGMYHCCLERVLKNNGHAHVIETFASTSQSLDLDAIFAYANFLGMESRTQTTYKVTGNLSSLRKQYLEQRLNRTSKTLHKRGKNGQQLYNRRIS
jgi:hypothetical protein